MHRVFSFQRIMNRMVFCRHHGKSFLQGSVSEIPDSLEVIHKSEIKRLLDI